MTAPKLRMSFTMAKLWANGDTDAAISIYLREKRSEPSQAMIDGKKYHEEWEEEIKKTGCLPAVFGGRPLALPEVENKIEFDMSDWLQVVGIPDCLEKGSDYAIHEFKTGTGSATDYGESMQVELQAWLIRKVHGVSVKKAYYHVYNQHTGEVKRCIVWITPERMEKAVEWFVSMASDMYHYLDENGLLKKAVV